MDIIPIEGWSDEKEICKNCEGDVVAVWYAVGDGPICNDCKNDFYEEYPCCDGYRQNTSYDVKRTINKISEEEKDAILDIMSIDKLDNVIDKRLEKKFDQKGW